MEVKTWIKYEMPYLPPRCRKTRYKECEEYVGLTLREARFADFVLAYEDGSFEGKGKIYRYGGSLWFKAKMPNLPKEDLERYGVKTPLSWLLWTHANSSTYFSTRYGNGDNATRAAMVEKAEDDIAKYILVDGVLYEKTSEPEYYIMTFGCGNGDGTGLFVSYPARRDCGWHFPAKEGDRAVAKAKEIAIARRDFASAKTFKKYITVYEK